MLMISAWTFLLTPKKLTTCGWKPTRTLLPSVMKKSPNLTFSDTLKAHPAQDALKLMPDNALLFSSSPTARQWEVLLYHTLSRSKPRQVSGRYSTMLLISINTQSATGTLGTKCVKSA